MPLTHRQQQVYDFLRRSVEERGFPPTVAEIAAHFGMRSPNAAAQHLRLMQQKGAIEIEAGVARGIRLNLHAGAAAKPTLARAAKSMPTIARELPIVGRVAAGSPILAEQNLEGSLAVDPAIFRPRADYLLRVVGDSMVGIGIHEGDFVAVRRTPEVRDGAVAVCRVGGDASGEVTVKRFARRGAIVSLRPENPRMKPIQVDLRDEELAIEGEVVGVVRVGVAAAPRARRR
jgi:repressor LexA